MDGSGFAPLAAGLRGRDALPETLHHGVIAVVDGAGRSLWSLGDTSRPFPLRSTAKPVQLLPFLLDGLDARHDADDADLGIMMASHNGEPAHVERVADLLRRFGSSEDALRCGTHAPSHEATRVALASAGATPTALHCNCSGKHAAMLAVCHFRGWSTTDYTAPDHPLQRRIEALLRTLAGEAHSPLPWSVDGCSLPTWWLSLGALARTFARFACPARAPALEGRAASDLLPRIYRAGTAHPDMVAGTDRLDTRLMRTLGGRVFAKSGADGLHAMAVGPTARHRHGLGIAIKVADGDPGSAVRTLVASRLLAQLDPEHLGDALELDDGARRNNRGTQVGERRILFQVETG